MLTAHKNHFLSIGHSVPRDVPNYQDTDAHAQKQRVLELLPEEALFLIERGSMFCYTHLPEDIISGGGELDGAPMTVQQAYSSMIGREGLTLEKYQVSSARTNLSQLF